MKKTLLICILVHIFSINAETHYYKLRPFSDLQTESIGNDSKLSYNYAEDNTPSVDWLSFFKNRSQLSSFSSLSEWESGTDYADIGAAKSKGSYSGVRLLDIDVPQSNFGISSLYNLRIAGNYLTHIDFLQGIKTANELRFEDNNLNNVNGLSSLTSVNYLTLFNNSLTEINGLSNLISVDDFLNISDNNLTNLNGLSSLKLVQSMNLMNNNLTNIAGLSNLDNISYYLYLNDNPSLKDISPLSNIINVGRGASFTSDGIYIDDPSQYTTNLDINGSLCDLILNGNANIIYNSQKVLYANICE